MHMILLVIEYYSMENVSFETTKFPTCFKIITVAVSFETTLIKCRYIRKQVSIESFFARTYNIETRTSLETWELLIYREMGANMS